VNPFGDRSADSRVRFQFKESNDMTINQARTWTTRLAVLLAAVALAGCASDVKLDEPAPVESRSATGTAGGAAGGAGSAAGTSQSQVASVDLSKGKDAAAEGVPNIVYFDYDSYVIKNEFRPIIEQHARLLNAERQKRLVIEGHTDERGGREYNLALGQKRAESVQKALALLGVNATQMESVSFGKERPAVAGSDEAAWAKNRRAELILK
jgi:peptidoglycan-associated lipoprotein